jgi:hypothetical protein
MTKTASSPAWRLEAHVLRESWRCGKQGGGKVFKDTSLYPSFSSAWWLRDVYVNDVARQADSNSSISEQTF